MKKADISLKCALGLRPSTGRVYLRRIAKMLGVQEENMTPLLEEALMSLTNKVNLSTGLLHYSDESAAKKLFKLLHKEAEALDKHEIINRAKANGWKEKYAKDLGKIAAHIGVGGRVVVRNKRMWRDNIIEQLRERASGNEA